MWKLGGFLLVGGATLALSGPALAAIGQQISVNGSGGATVPAGATNGQQQTAYDEALTAAIHDAQTKAGTVAQQLSLTLGPVQTFTEQSIDYLGYCGVGLVSSVGATGVSGAPAASGSATTGQLTPIPPKPKTKKHKAKKHKAKKPAHAAQASSNSCQIEADVTIAYSAT